MSHFEISLIGIVALAIVYAVIDRGFRRVRPDAHDSGWFGGVFYFKRDDKRLLVPKRFGLGRTFNLAHPGVWLLLGVLLVIVLVRKV